MSTDGSHIITGKQGEDAAADYIIKHGYELLARNWRFKRCEVDAIACKGKVLHFFEVKTRSSNYILPEESVSTKKLGKLKEAAQEYLYQHPQWKMIQFNILSIIIRPDMTIEYFLIEDVF
jgi:putative endonuclease